MTNEITVESTIPSEVVRQLHDDAHHSLKSIAADAGIDGQLVRDLYHGTVEHVAISAANSLYAVQAQVELANARLARKWQL